MEEKMEDENEFEEEEEFNESDESDAEESEVDWWGTDSNPFN